MPAYGQPAHNQVVLVRLYEIFFRALIFAQNFCHASRFVSQPILHVVAPSLAALKGQPPQRAHSITLCPSRSEYPLRLASPASEINDYVYCMQGHIWLHISLLCMRDSDGLWRRDYLVEWQIISRSHRVAPYMIKRIWFFLQFRLLKYLSVNACMKGNIELGYATKGVQNQYKYKNSICST